MAYNKARAEKKWLKWKEAEEKKLRELGVDEGTIQRLHTYDWAEFNRERRYLQRQVEWSPYVDMISAQPAAAGGVVALCGYDFGAGLGTARRGCGIPHGQH